MKKRLKRLCKGLGCEASKNLYPYSLRRDLALPEAIEEMKQHIPPDTKLIFLDNFEKYWASDMDAVAVSAAMKLMRELRDHTSIALIHHTVKKTSGSSNMFQKSKGLSEIANNADASLSLMRRGEIITCELYARELEELPPFRFRLADKEDGSITLEATDYVQSPSPEQKDKDCLNAVRNILATNLNKPMKKTLIYEELLKGRKILSGANFHNTVFNQLVQEGSLIQIDKGLYVYKKTSELPATS